MRRFLLPALVLWFAGCPANDDFDGDGFVEPEDCNDNNEFAFPGAEEIPYDRVDQDCDGFDLNDVDGDGVDGLRGGGLDCDDEDAAVFPGAEEIPYDGLDNNCDGSNDDDFDGDGFEAVERGGQDCNDFDATIVPLDTDGDGFTPCTGDCDETDKFRNPLAEPICGNKIDDNCDGVSDCALTGTLGLDVAPTRLDGEDGKLVNAEFGTALAAPGDVIGDAAADLIVAGYSNPELTEGAVWWFDGPLDASQDVTSAAASVNVPGGDLHLAASGPRTAIAYDVRGESAFVGVFGGAPAGAATFDSAGLTIRHSVVVDIDPVTRAQKRSDQRMGDAIALLDGGATVAVGAKEDGCLFPDPGKLQHAGGCGSVNLVPTSLTGTIDYASEGAMILGTSNRRVGQRLHSFDYDGDGVDDLFVGSDGFDTFLVDPNASLVLAPPTSGVHMIADVTDAEVDLRTWGDGLGGAAFGDLDGDGTDDLVVGSPRLASRNGGVAVFTRTATGTLDPDAAEILRFALGQDMFGEELLVEDLDGDGAMDLIVGAPATLGAGGEDEGGAVHVWYGPLTPGSEVSLQADLTLDGVGKSGRSLAGAALAFDDIDNDGYADLVASSPGESAGAVYVFYGGATAIGGL